MWGFREVVSGLGSRTWSLRVSGFGISSFLFLGFQGLMSRDWGGLCLGISEFHVFGIQDFKILNPENISKSDVRCRDVKVSGFKV